MGTGVHIRFLVDEHLPARALIPLLGNRGHQAAPVELRAENPVILARAEECGSVVITADKWFLAELLQHPLGHGDCYTRAGVIQVLGT
jgi:predicted nuclease of predicted toxin-antitoxin system